MKKVSLTWLSSALLLTGFALPAWAASAITGISLADNQHPDSPVIAVEFAGTPTPPRSFSLANPPRIAFDFGDTKNQTGKTQFPLNSNALASTTLIEGQNKSRLVLALGKASAYSTRIDKNRVLITLAAATDKPDASLPQEPPTEILPPVVAAAPNAVAPNGVLRNIDFRRGTDGTARVVIDLPTAGTPTDIRREGKNLILDLQGVKAPRSLERRLDVTDFATPATRIDTLNQGSGSRVTISSEGNWAYSSYQTDRKLVIEIRKISQEESDATLAAQGKTTYKGERLSLNFQNVEVRSLLQVIAEFTGLNVIVSDAVSGSLTLRLKDVPWDQALDLILAQKNLDKRQAGNVIRIAPREEIIAIDKQTAEANKQRTISEPMITETIQVRYRAAEEVRDALKGLVTTFTEQTSNSASDSTNLAQNSNSNSNTNSTRSVASTQSSIFVDPRTNKLIIRDRVSSMEEIRKIIQLLDVPLRQVLIEARIVEASDNFQRDLGVRLGFSKVGADTAVGAKPDGLTVGGAPGAWTPNVNLPAALTGATIGAIFRNASTVIGLELSAMQAEGTGKIVSSPRILTADRKQASITEGVEIPYQSTGSDGTSTTTFKKANLNLTVTPSITPDDDVILNLNITKDTPNVKLKVGENPSIDNKTINTEVRVENGGTVVIGGVYVQEQSNNESKVPLLGDIPGLGALFRNNSVVNTRRELLVFITPRIVESALFNRQ